MLKIYKCGDRRLETLDPKASPDKIPRAVWFDLQNPSPEEFAFVVRETGLSLPEEADIVEIENSSRLSSDGAVVTVTMPIVTRAPHEGMQGSSCAFVLAPDRLVTIRFAPSLVFDKFPEQPHEVGADEAGSKHGAYLFVGLLEAIVDKQADALEAIRNELDGLSRKVFRRKAMVKEARRKGTRAPNEEAELEANLVTLGIAHDEVSLLRDSQLGIDRIAPYVSGTADWLPKPVVKRLNTLREDVHSLNDFNTHLTDKVQFLLDATLGLINIAQSTLMKVFTIVSVVGIPPTLIAGIYGMNFKIIPELSWTYGYAYAWVVMILSAVLPLLWFRAKSWI
jgi:magnesium transporter